MIRVPVCAFSILFRVKYWSRGKKRPHKTLTIDEKVKILDQIGKKIYAVIAEEYSIGCATITDIKRKEVAISHACSRWEPGGLLRL